MVGQIQDESSFSSIPAPNQPRIIKTTLFITLNPFIFPRLLPYSERIGAGAPPTQIHLHPYSQDHNHEYINLTQLTKPNCKETSF